MTRTLYTFKHQLSKSALHVDYLRLRCGREKDFRTEIAQVKGLRAQIAFAEWDVALLIPCTELYPKTLIDVYSKEKIAETIAGSTGFFNYLWDHPVNRHWEARICGRTAKTFSMLVSVRFTEAFRRRLGIGAELLFCDFLEEKLDEYPGVTAVVAHSVGWNDVTIILDAEPGSEDRMIDTLTTIRFCTYGNCQVGDSSAGIIAATYSHLLGDLGAYEEQHQLPFDSLKEHVKGARILVRVTPDGEMALRQKLSTLLEESLHERQRVGSEFGHYNFSAEIGTAFQDPSRVVNIVQTFREYIGASLAGRTDESSFPETTTEITLAENLNVVHHDAGPELSAPDIETLSSHYKKQLKQLLGRIQNLEAQASSMTRHRLAILLGTIITYLDDPVRGSVVNHLCRFLASMFVNLLRESDRAGQEDLCHILEYALQQATEGLTQFQHDANSLGLNGRGGYNKLIQAVEEFIDQVLDSFKSDLVPLITFGLRPSSEGTSLKYWIDLPFSTAFVPERWYVAYFELARMCWQRTFDWRLDSYRAWLTANKVTPVTSHRTESDRMHFVLARDVADELFPSYMVLHLVAAGDGAGDPAREAAKLDRLLIAKEFLTQPRPALIHELTVRLAIHALLSVHGQFIARHPAIPPVSDPLDDKGRNAIALEWWGAWSAINALVQRKQPTTCSEVASAIEQGAQSLRSIIDSLKDQHPYAARDAAHAFESTATLISTQTFKMDVLRIVEDVLELLAARAADHQRQSTHYPLYDPFLVQFGQMIAGIRSLRKTVAELTPVQVAQFRTGIEDGAVFAVGPDGPSLARILTATGENHAVKDTLPHHPSMVSSLSSILSLWHAAATKDLSTRKQPEHLLDTLIKLNLVHEWPTNSSRTA
jgi:hypothetical protein